MAEIGSSSFPWLRLRSSKGRACCSERIKESGSDVLDTIEISGSSRPGLSGLVRSGKCRLAGTWTAGTPLGFFPSRSEYPVGFGSEYPVTSSTAKFWSLAIFLRVSFRSEYPVEYGSDYPVSTSTGCDENVVIPR